MDKIKAAFDQIHAEEHLKQETLNFLRDRMRQPEPKKAPIVFRRLLAACACLLILFFAGWFAHGLYFTETMYIDMDINPSVELTVNRFDNVIGVYAYNEDGEQLLSTLSLLHEPYQTAAEQLTRAAIDQGFLEEGGLVSVTLQTEDRQAAALTDALQSDIIAVTGEILSSVEADVFAVDSDTREHAHAQNISPAKYLAILELQQADPTVTMDSCKGHSIGEIRALTEAHGNRHGTEKGDGSESEAPAAEESSAVQSSSAASGTHGGGHHGNGHE